MTLRYLEVYTDDDALVPPDGTAVVTILNVSRIGDQFRWSVVVTEAPDA